MSMYAKLRARLDRAGIRPSTRRGQNFLLDSNQLRFIAESGNLTPNDVVLEVGPGSGFLTRRLALSGAIVLGVELDHGLLPVAQEETAGLPNVFYLRADILEGKNKLNPGVAAKLRELLALKEHPVLKSVSNLPYSAGTPFIMNALASDLPWHTGIFLLQTEVAERIVAAPGGKNYGAISIAAGLAAETFIEREVSPKCFWPRPNVDSSVIRVVFRPVEERLALPWAQLRAVTNAVFGWPSFALLFSAVCGLMLAVEVIKGKFHVPKLRGLAVLCSPAALLALLLEKAYPGFFRDMANRALLIHSFLIGLMLSVFRARDIARDTAIEPKTIPRFKITLERINR